MPPVDKALCWLIEQGPLARWTIAELVDLTGAAVPLVEAERISAALVRYQVLAMEDGVYRPGPRGAEWRKIEQAVRGKRAGNDLAYRRAQAVRDAVRQRVWRATNPQLIKAPASGSRMA